MRLLGAIALALLVVTLLATLRVRTVSAPDDALVVLFDAAPSVLDPRFATSDYDGKLARLVFAGLLTFDTPDGRPQPWLAERWAWESPTRLRVHLRPDLRFHDGTPLTSRDVVATWQSLGDPSLASPIAGSLRGVDVRDDGPHTLVFELDAPDASFETRLDLGVLRASDVGRVVDPARAVGSGPWAVERWDPRGGILLVPHPQWAVSAPAERALFVRVVPDANTRTLTVLAGRADLAQNAIPPALLSVFDRPRDGARASRWTVESTPSFKYSYVVMNLDVPELADVRVRRAIAHAIDRDAVIAARLQGRAIRATGMLPPAHWAHASAVDVWHYDLARARALLDEAGIPAADERGCRLRWTWKVSTHRLYRSIAEAIAAQLAEVGICIAVQAWEWGTFFDDVRRGRFELASLQWTSVLDPDIHRWTFHSESIPTADNGFVGANRGRYRNPEMDRLLDQARTTVDAEARAALYAEVQALAARDLPYIPLWHEDHVVVRSERAAGYRAVPTGRLTELRWVSARPAAHRAPGR